MQLNFSQKRLYGAPLRHKGKKGGKSGSRISAKARKHAERLELYAFLTGLMSTLISLASTILMAIK